MIMNMLLIKNFFVGFMVSEIPRVSVFGYFPLYLINSGLIISLNCVLFLKLIIKTVIKFYL